MTSDRYLPKSVVRRRTRHMTIGVRMTVRAGQEPHSALGYQPPARYALTAPTNNPQSSENSDAHCDSLTP